MLNNQRFKNVYIQYILTQERVRVLVLEKTQSLILQQSNLESNSQKSISQVNHGNNENDLHFTTDFNQSKNSEHSETSKSLLTQQIPLVNEEMLKIQSKLKNFVYTYQKEYMSMKHEIKYLRERNSYLESLFQIKNQTSQSNSQLYDVDLNQSFSK